jgi:sialate O-acetylesterase
VRALGVFLACMLAVVPVARAGLRLPALFADGAVLQRDRPIRIWGEADPGTAVQVEFDGMRALGRADGAGRWHVELPAHAAGGPYVLAIRNGGELRRLANVLVGDVWLASGQSNMEWTVAQSWNAGAEMASAADPAVRHFKVPHAASAQALTRLGGGSWIAAAPETVGGFSAVAYFFAREIHARTGVPVGVIDSSWGGSRIEAWMDAGSNGLDAVHTEAQLKHWQQEQAVQAAATRKRIAAWGPQPVDDAQWSRADFDDRDWEQVDVPGLWEDHGYAGMDGVAWYRKRFRLGAEQAARGVTLSLARIDDSDRTFVNGHAVGGVQGGWDVARRYVVPASALQPGWNVVAVRVTDTGGGGGFHGDAAQMHVDIGDGQRLQLAGAWRFRPAMADTRDGASELAKSKPTMLYNGMIHPLQPYGLRGVIWYQGESNAGNADAGRYRSQFAAMLQQWRRQWNAPGLPFLWVQLPNFRGDSTVDWALLRESQSKVLALPATAQVVAIDIGDPLDIHPGNKQEVARRLALAARSTAYGERLVSSGPVFRSATFEGGQARIAFDLQGSQLALRGIDSDIPGFEVAGDDGVFYPAQARLRGEQVVVGSDAVPQPKSVRYAWRNDPGTLTLVNAEGLPAAPFRSAGR